MSLMALVILAGVLYALHNAAIKLAGDILPPSLAVTVFLILGAMTTGVIYWFGDGEKAKLAQFSDWRLILALVVAGTTIGLVDYFYVSALTKGAPLSVAGPLFTTVSLTLIFAIGVLFFSEAVTFAKLSGVVLLVAGITLIAR